MNKMDSTISPESSGRQSRRELLATISQQKEQLSRYEARLKDVVRAYKGLAKEKEALEKSVVVLRKTQLPSADDTLDTNNSCASEDINTLTDSADSNASGVYSTKDGETINKNISAKDNDTASDLKVLQNSLATLTAEKTRNANAYQEEKKRMKQEKQELENAQQQVIKEHEGLKAKFKSETEELKSKWIVERHNREKESSDNTLMLRELQKIVGEERAGKERLESELQEARDRLKALELAGSYNEEYEKRVRLLEVETKQKNVEISRLASKCAETPPELIQLKQEADDMRHGHKRDLERAEAKAAYAENESNTVRATHEKRVVNLESRLQELSETVGTYDRLRNQDQVSIQKMKERVHQLEAEKSTLLLSSTSCTSSARSSPERENSDAIDEMDKDGDEDTNLDVQTLLDRILRLKTLLRNANQRSENPIENLDDLLYEGSNASKWKKTAHLMKEELEKLKKDTNVEHKLIPNLLGSGIEKHTERAEKDYMTAEELQMSPSKTRIQLMESESKVQTLNLEVSNLKDHIRMLKKDHDEYQREIKKLQEQESIWKQEMALYKATCKESQTNAEVDLKNRILSLEEELKKQRERCLTIIEEKEDEVNMLKSNMESTLEAAFRAAAKTAANSALTRGSSMSNEESIYSANISPSLQIENSHKILSASIIESAVSKASSSAHNKELSNLNRLRRTKSGSVGRDQVTEDLTASSSQQAEGMVLYYEEEISHKEVEIKDLRHKARELESSLRDLQMSFIGKEEKYSDEIDILRIRVSTLQRMTTKEGANLEYLKNVVLTYMLTAAAAEREHMLKAIAAVLSFSKDELRKVRHYNASWWWNEKANITNPGALPSSSSFKPDTS